MYIETLLNVPVPGTFTYSTDNPDIKVGLRVEVPFGRRKMTAFCISVSETLPESAAGSCTEEKIKPIHRIIDKEPVFTDELVELSSWLSRYYLCTQGEALSAMIPSGRRGTNAGLSFFEDDETSYTKHTLSEKQEKAVHDILVSATDNEGSTFKQNSQFHYLYGQTGTGKTEVFLGAAERVLEQGKGVIYLVPEIGLTQQVIDAVFARFGSTAAVLHSGLTGSQRLTEWKRIMKKEARVVIGARSAIFAPVPDLGLIIIDEEHDSSYKSGNTPRYHARQVAMHRVSRLGIPLIMGSATPSVEAWHLMNSGAIKKHTLSKRLAGGAMPEISVLDLSHEQLNGCLSDRLTDEIRETLNEKRQVILFLNRRGFTHFFRCRTCGYELKCRNCSVALTYHRNEGRLRCHYCGYTVPVPSQCPECGSLDVGYSGFGTEFIEDEVKAKFPLARIDRIDTDVLEQKGALQEKIAAFKRGETDILLGTQMVAKGLNFPNLKLVGVILADTGLHLPDFRASERTFSLLVQVAGRAGRFFPDGKVIVQSYCPERPAISLACRNDMNSFYEGELQERQIIGFPPFARLLRLVFRSAEKQKAEDAAASAREILSQLKETLASENSASVEILGPAECPLSMIAANYRQQLLLRSTSISAMQKLVACFINNYKTPSGIYMEIDVDPLSLL